MRKIDPFHYGRIEKDEVNQQAFENYFQLIDEAERFYNDQIRRVVKSMSTGKDKTDVICLSGPSASGKTTTAHTAIFFLTFRFTPQWPAAPGLPFSLSDCSRTR